MQEEYNGQIITYSEYISMFECNIGNGEILQSHTLKDIKNRIDAAIKRQKAFKKVKCYATSGWYGDSFTEAEITSINLQTGKIYYTQISKDGKKNKRQTSFNELKCKKIFAQYTNANKEIFNKINEKENELEKIKKEILALESQMQSIKDIENLA